MSAVITAMVGVVTSSLFRRTRGPKSIGFGQGSTAERHYSGFHKWPMRTLAIIMVCNEYKHCPPPPHHHHHHHHDYIITPPRQEVLPIRRVCWLVGSVVRSLTTAALVGRRPCGWWAEGMVGVRVGDLHRTGLHLLPRSAFF